MQGFELLAERVSFIILLISFTSIFKEIMTVYVLEIIKVLYVES